MVMNSPDNGVRADIENMKEDIREIKTSLKEMTTQLTERNRLMEAELSTIREDHAVFKARIYTIGGAIGAIWTIGTILAAKFL